MNQEYLMIVIKNWDFFYFNPHYKLFFIYIFSFLPLYQIIRFNIILDLYLFYLILDDNIIYNKNKIYSYNIRN